MIGLRIVIALNGEDIDQVLTSVTIVAIDTMNDLRDTIVITSQDRAEEADQETAMIATIIREEDQGHRPMKVEEVKITIIEDELIF